MRKPNRAALLGAMSAIIVPTTFVQAQTAPTEDRNGGLEEVIVTAQRREESLQEVPVAVSAISGQNLENAHITDVQSLTQLVPSLNVQSRGNLIQPTIRGVGTAANTVGNEPNVAVYIDGAYQPISVGNSFRFFDIERVEVLRGPQGTLFGRNATGGLLNFITRDPSTDAYHGTFAASYSRFNRVDLDGYLTGPISDSLAFGVTSYYTRSDGYLENPNRPGENVAENKSAGVRGKLLFAPNEDVAIKLIADYVYLDDPTPVLPSIAADSTRYRSPAGPAPFLTQTDTPYQTTSNFAKAKYEQTGATLDAKITLGALDLISVSSWRKSTYEATNDGDITPYHAVKLEFEPHTETYSEDIRVQSNGDGPWQWIAGVFGIYNKENYEPFNFQFGAGNFIPGALNLNNFTAANYVSVLVIDLAQVKTDAYAFYGQTSYELTDKLTATAGLRYSSENKESLAIAPGRPTQKDDTTFEDTSPKISLDYKFTKDTMAYVSYGKAFKSGTYNPIQIGNPGRPTDANILVQPEKISAYEAGLKSELTRNIRANLAAFYYDYKQLQTTVNNGQVNILRNAGDAKVKGAELELLGQFPGLFDDADRFTMSVNVAYLNSRYLDTLPVPVPVLNGPGLGTSNVLINLKGKELVRAPEWTQTVGVEYQRAQSWGTARLNVDAYFNSGYFFDEGNNPAIAQPQYENVNAAVSWTDPRERYTVSLWGKNLTDEETFMHPFLQSTGSPNAAFGKAWYPPRTYGVTLKVNF